MVCLKPIRRKKTESKVVLERIVMLNFVEWIFELILNNLFMQNDKSTIKATSIGIK